MALTIHPGIGQMLMCDFSTGFRTPEMVKVRPVIVLSTRRGGLVTVVALSTAAPDPVERCHIRLPKACMPQLRHFQERDSWVKGDMIYTVGHHRLNLIRLGKRDPDTGKRIYFTQKLGSERMKEVYGCILHGLNIGHVARHL